MKKFFSNAFLIWGGIYFLTDFILMGGISKVLSEDATSTLSTILLLVFIGIALMIAFRKAPKFITNARTTLPRLCAYFASIDWIPYVSAVLFPVFYLLVQFTSFGNWFNNFFEDKDTEFIFGIMLPLIGYAILALCLGFAAYYNFRTQRKQRKTHKS